MNNPTIGQNLAIAEHRLRAEDLQAQRQARRQRWVNNFVIWITLLMLGIALGYHWRMKQEQAFEIKIAFEAEDIAYDATQVMPCKISRKYLTGGTNSWLEEI